MAVPMWRLYTGEVLGRLKKMRPGDAQCVFGSPPYPNKGERYGKGTGPMRPEEWIELMYQTTRECLRICNGMVGWVVNGSVIAGDYDCAIEELMLRLKKNLPIVVCRPIIWTKNAPNAAKGQLRNSWEYVLGFHNPSHLVRFNWEAIASPPKYSRGGAYRQRDSKGKRKAGNDYPDNKLARPCDVWYVTVGGGHMGHKLAHKNEAPFPLKLAERYIRLFSDVGDVILDPFCGSGTTLDAAIRHGRRGLGIDIRDNQIKLAARRLREVQDELESAATADAAVASQEDDHAAAD